MVLQSSIRLPAVTSDPSLSRLPITPSMLAYFLPARQYHHNFVVCSHQSTAATSSPESAQTSYRLCIDWLFHTCPRFVFLLESFYGCRPFRMPSVLLISTAHPCRSLGPPASLVISSELLANEGNFGLHQRLAPECQRVSSMHLIAVQQYPIAIFLVSHCPYLWHSVNVPTCETLRY